MYRKRLARLTSNHSDIQAHFIAQFDRINFKPILLRPGRAPGVNKILPDLSLRKFKTAIPPPLYLGAEAPCLYNTALGQIHYFHIAMPRLRRDKILRNHR